MMLGLSVFEAMLKSHWKRCRERVKTAGCGVWFPGCLTLPPRGRGLLLSLLAVLPGHLGWWRSLCSSSGMMTPQMKQQSRAVGLKLLHLISHQSHHERTWPNPHVTYKGLGLQQQNTDVGTGQECCWTWFGSAASHGHVTMCPFFCQPADWHRDGPWPHAPM